MNTLQQKQHYITSQIQEDEYEAFYDYVGEKVGNFDIEKWPSHFLVQLVKQFHTNRKEQNSKLETSFYEYQHAPGQVVEQAPVQENILPRELTQQEAPNSLVLLDGIFRRNSFKKVQEKRQLEQEERKFKKTPKVFLDAPKSPSQQLSTAHFQTADPKKPPTNSTFFQEKGSNFWGVKPPQTVSQKHIQPKSDFTNFDDFGSIKPSTVAALPVMQAPSPQPAKSDADFASFDFWSQPSKSPNDFKSMNLPAKNVPTPRTSQQVPIPSFQQLMANLAQDKQKEVQKQQVEKKKEQPEKIHSKAQPVKDASNPFLTPVVSKKAHGPSPYQKKDYPSDNPVLPKKAGQVMGGKEGFKDMVKCFPAAHRPRINVENISVTIAAHEIVSRTFLMPDYVMFTLHVKPLGFHVQRNYEDFQRLRATLAKHYPGFKLSYLESSSWFGATHPEVVGRQIIWLQFFINDLLQSQQLRNSRILEEFLTLPEHKQIKRKFQEYEKLQKPKGIEDLCLLPGRVTVALNDHQRKYQDQLKIYQEKMVALLERQERLSQQLSQYYRRAGQTLTHLKQVAESVIGETMAFNRGVYGLEIEEIEEVFSMVKECYDEEIKNVMNGVEAVGKLHVPFLSYEKENLKQLSELLNQQQFMLRAYLKRKQSEKDDRNLPYDSKKHEEYKLGVLEESRNLLVLKYQAGYLSNQVCLEAKRVLETLGIKTAKRWEEYCLKRCLVAEKQSEFYRSNCSSETAQKL